LSSRACAGKASAASRMIANFAKRRSLLQKKARPEPGFY
jgi:hypothetical protein